MKREEKLAALVPNENTTVLLTAWPSVRYYAGESAKEGTALLAWDGGSKLLSSLAGIKDLALPNQVARLEIEPDALTAAQAMKLKNTLPVEIDFSGALGERIYAQRLHKSSEEIEKIKQAQSITDRAFERLLNSIHAGMTDREVQKRIADLLWEEGSQMTSFNHVVGCGAATADPHVRPDGRTLGKGDLVMVDIGAIVDGYGSDMTRMIAVGEADEEKRRVFDLVMRAQSAGMGAAKVGAICSEVDAAARAVIEQAGYAEFFPHGLGHPVGSGGREGPRFSPSDHSLLTTDIVMTVEPGVYLPGKFGVRTENMVLIGACGTQNLTGVERKLFVV